MHEEVAGDHQRATSGRAADGELLDRCIAKCTQHCVDTSLVAGALGLEPLQYVLIYAQRDRGLRWLKLETSTNDATDDVPDVSLRMVGNRYAFGRSQAGEVSLGLG